MRETNDLELLSEFARNGSGGAFAEVVARYVNLVHSTALRFTSNPHHAQDITQAVFIILAQKAGKLPASTILSGWLYQTARLTAANFMKGEIRRQKREQEAYMESTLNELASEKAQAAWEQIAPMLDEAMGSLGESDRNAIILRYFENKTAQETGMALKTTEAAAQKRVTRALEKLRKIFTKRGVALPAALIASAVMARAVMAAPMGLGAAAAASVTKESVIPAAIKALVKGTMKKMIWLKLKFAVAVCVAVVAAGGLATVAFSQSGGGPAATPPGPGGTATPPANSQTGSAIDAPALREIVRLAQDTYDALSSYSDTGTVMEEAPGMTTKTTFSIRLQRPNLYRVSWASAGGSPTGDGSAWSDGDGDYLEIGTGGKNRMKDMTIVLASATGVSGQAATSIPGIFFHQSWGNMLALAHSDGSELRKEADGRIGDVDCHVISIVPAPSKIPPPGDPSKFIPPPPPAVATKLWIGKQDHLIHQIQMSMDMASVVSATQKVYSDAEIKALLERQNKQATPEAIAAMRNRLESAMKQVQDMAKPGKIVFTQTHENIRVNTKFSPADFAR